MDGGAAREESLSRGLKPVLWPSSNVRTKVRTYLRSNGNNNNGNGDGEWLGLGYSDGDAYALEVDGGADGVDVGADDGHYAVFVGCDDVG